MKQQIIDSKVNPNATGEADDCLFEYLHAELVNYVLSKSSNTAVSNKYKMIKIKMLACIMLFSLLFIIKKFFENIYINIYVC